VVRGTPVIVTGAIDSTGGQSACAKWNLDYLKQRLGDAQCEVHVSPPNRCPGSEIPLEESKYVRMGASECIERMSAPDRIPPLFWPNERYYLYRAPTACFDPILSDIVTPDFIPFNRATDESNLWFSPAGNITLPHIDFVDNLLVQVRGHKHMLLWDPSHWRNMYVHRIGEPRARQSQVDPMKPDFARFPLFAQARAQHCVLNPGDGLFIPFGYIHCVYAATFAISINYWWGGHALSRLRSTLRNRGLVGYLANAPWTAATTVAHGILRRLKGGDVTHDRNDPSVIDTVIKLGN
jgi:hypothetical protein